MKTIDALTLTPKQQRFCDEYLIDMNATRAALRAGYSQNTALNGQLMEVPKIQAYLKERRAEASQKLQIDHETLLGELMKVAFANMGDYFGDDGKIKPMQEIIEEKKSAIWSLKVSEGKYGTTVQLRLHSKLAALEKIAKHIKFYEPEKKQPEQVHVYVDKEDLNENDRFEDDSVDRLDQELEDRRAKVEAREYEVFKKELLLKQREDELARREGIGAGRGRVDGVAMVVGDNTNNGGAVHKAAAGETGSAVANQFTLVPFGGGRHLSEEVRKERRQQYRDNPPGAGFKRGLRNDVGRFFSGRKFLLG
jgi:phage terminase small subunit